MTRTAWLILALASLLWASVARAADVGLIASYDFDEDGDGAIALDTSGNEQHGRIHGARRVEAGRAFCLQLDGQDDYVDCGQSKSTRLRAITLQAWIRPAAVPAGEPGIIGFGGSFDQGYGLTLFENACSYFYAAGGANNCLAAITPEQWQHLAATFDGAQMHLYINGRLRASRKLPSRVSVPHLGNLLIGRNGHFHFKGLIDNVRMHDRALPSAAIRVAYEAELDQVVRPVTLPPLVEPRMIHRGAFSVMAGDGAIEIDVGTEVYRIASQFSFPGHQVKHQRKVDVRGGRIEVEDELTNGAEEPVGIVMTHTISGKQIFREMLLAGGDAPVVASVAENPSLFLAQRHSGIGIVAEDSLSRLQFEANAANDRAAFGVKHFALAGGATHRFRWAVYPLAEDDGYFDFANAVRRDWNSNYTIHGPFDWLEVDHPRTIELLNDPAKLRSHLARRPLGIVALLPFLSYHAGAPLTREAYREMMQSARRKLKEAAPHIRCLGSIENNIVSYERSKLSRPDILDSVSRNSGFYPLPLSAAQTTMLRAELPWKDSLIIGRDGLAMVEDCMPTTFVHPMVYAAPGNYHSAYLMDQAKFLVEEVGLDGVYIDHFNMAFEPQQRYDFSKWDGTTVDIDPATGQIAARYTDAALVGIRPREALCRFVLSAGKAMVANTPNVASEMQSLAVMHLAEVGSQLDARSLQAGVEPPLVPHLAKLQLGSPIAIGVPSSNRSQPHVQDAEEVMKVVIAYLRHGLLYYHNQTTVPEAGEGSGQYGPINHMFPITPVALHKGWIEGKERTVACVSTDLKLAGAAPPTILLFDLSGRPGTHAMQPVKADDGWMVSLKVRDWAQIAVVVNPNYQGSEP